MNTKLMVALVIVGVLAVMVVGLAAAQITTSYPNGSTTNGSPNNGFFGWIGNCFRFRSAPYYGTQSPVYPNLPANITVPNPYTNTTTTYQGYYGYGRSMGSGFIP
jgi:hypothetical protein